MVLRLRLTNIPEQAEKISVVVLLVVTGVPIAQCIPGGLRSIIQILAAFVFLFCRLIKKKLLWQNVIMVFMIGFGVLFHQIVWEKYISFEQYVYYMMVFWCFTFYGIEILTSLRYEVNGILLVVLAIMTTTAITTIIGLLRYPLAVRHLGKTAGFLTSSARNLYLSHNIATWNHMYGIAIMAPCFLEIYRRTKNKVSVFCFITCEVAVIMSQLTYALILSMIMVLMMVINRIRKKKDIIIWIVGSTLIIILLLNYNSILIWAINFASSRQLATLSNKLSDLQILLYSRNIVGDAEARFDQYGKSLQQFVIHPVFGSFLNGRGQSGLFGHHSDILDILGCFGLVGIAIMLALGRKYIKVIRKNAIYTKYYYVAFVGIILLSVVNPVLYGAVTAVGGFTIPAMIDKAFPVGEERV